MTNLSPFHTTVIIPCYNGAAFVGAAIESCLAEGLPGKQIIVIDDGSTDDTPQVLAGWANRIRVHHKENGGASTARNTGLALVETRHVIFLDADDTYEGGILGALETEMLEQDADLGLGCTQVIQSDGKLVVRLIPPDIVQREVFLESWLSGHTVQTNSHMWRVDFLRDIGGWREDMRTLEEIEIVLRATLVGATLARSETGHSCYIDRGNTDRVRYGNSESVIRSAVEGFAAIEPALKTRGQSRALGKRFYLQARSAFRQGHLPLGRDALARARACGFRGHLGTREHRMLAGLLGLELKERWSGRRLS